MCVCVCDRLGILHLTDPPEIQFLKAEALRTYSPLPLVDGRHGCFTLGADGVVILLVSGR